MMAETKLDPELKAKWVEALRSGKFVQGETDLHDCSEDTYCCLGVLQAIVGVEKLPKHKNNWEYLNYAEAEAIGLTKKTQEDLAQMNDQPFSFGHIAKWIEDNL